MKQSNLETPAKADLYLPLRQVPKDGVPWLRNSTYWVLKTSPRAPVIEPLLRAEIRKVDASVAVGDLRPMTEVMAAALAARRFTLLLVGSFAGTALFLAAAGLYAVISYGIQQRTREIGVRLALGATHANILAMIFREGALLLGAGIAAGLAVALMMAKLVVNQMYGISERDPSNFAFVILLLAAISLLACWIAARGQCRSRRRTSSRVRQKLAWPGASSRAFLILFYPMLATARECSRPPRQRAPQPPS